jgi:mono/diheme cytochrome c family protein
VPNDDTIGELMLEWEAARQEGRQLTVEQLCADCPEHADELRAMIGAVLNMEHVLSATLIHSSQGDRTDFDARLEPLPAIPGYEVLRIIDRGGMGIVYEARHLDLGRTVAIKMIAAERMRPNLVDRFQAEAEAAARIQHPNFVQIFEIGRAGGKPFYSMEYVAGGNLAELLRKQSPSARSAAQMTLTLAQAVHAAHECGIVHRDLKPSNVMLTVDGTLKIADFGLAKRLDDNFGQTHTGEILGTPSYMAPEQAEGRKSDIGPRTDVYSLGAILYELLVGKPPFLGASPLDSLRRVLAEDPVAPSRLVPSIPRDLEAICLKCLEKTPNRRYASARALADDLRCFLEDRPVSARRSGPLRRAWKFARRHHQVITQCGAIAVLLSIPVGLWLAQHFTEREIRQKAVLQAPVVREILRRNCYACHGQDVKDVRKNLDILNHRQLLDSERRIVVPGAPEDSRLIQRIADGSMPPEEEELDLPRLSESDLLVLKAWILGGAPPFAPADASAADEPAPPDSDVAAAAKGIFQKRCYQCHKYDVAKGGIKIMHHRLLVTVRKVVIPGKPEKSELFQLLTAKDDARMPPDSEPRLTAEEIEIIRTWILEGAPPFPKK